MIRRSPRPESKFYVLDKSISEDARLSWGARGLLIYLLGKPDNWEISVSHLKAQTASSAKATGRDGIYKLLDELIAAGYVKRVSQKHSEGGRFASMDYEVSEVSDCPKVSEDVQPCPPLPYTAQPCTAQPCTAKTTLTSNEPYQGLKEQQGLKENEGGAAPQTADMFDQLNEQTSKRTKGGAAIELLAEYGVTGELANEFVAFRKMKRAIISRTVLDGLKSEGAKVGMTVAEAIRESILRNWQGFKADWVTEQKKSPLTGGSVNGVKSKSHQQFAEKYPHLVGK